MKTEICIEYIEEALMADKLGADRVELCSALSEGGLTPSMGVVNEVIASTKNIEVFVMIRPRGGSFVYNDFEINAMTHDIKKMKEIGVHGIVFGVLTKENEINYRQTEMLLSAAKGMSTTFHRAFDFCKDPIKSAQKLEQMGINRILTSGQKPTAIEGNELIGNLISNLKGNLIILPGSGINPNNIIELREKTGASEFHFTSRKLHANQTAVQGMGKNIIFDQDKTINIIKKLR